MATADDAADDTADDVVDDTADDAVDDNADEDAADDAADDEGAADADATPEEPADDPAASSVSRRESRNARQARENRELREKLARADGELAALKKPQTPADTVAAQRERAERVALMTPEEKANFESQEKIASLQNESRATQLLILDMGDKNEYAVRCAKDSVAAKYKDRVEELLASMRKNGTNAPRDTLLKYLVGEDALKRSSQTVTKKQTQAQKDAAAARVAQSKGKATSARGDAGGSGKGGSDLAAMKARLLAREARGDVN